MSVIEVVYRLIHLHCGFVCLTLSEVAAEILGRVGGVQDILAALRTFPSNQEIAFQCCTALWALSVVGECMIVT